MALPKAKADVTDDHLDRFPEDAGAGWLARARNTARTRWADMGMPVRRDEYWRYTDPKGYTDQAAAFETVSEPTEVFDAVDAVTLTFVDGVLDVELSDDAQLEGASVERLSDVAALDLHWAKDHFGHLEAAGQLPVARPLAALTTQIATDGLLVHVTGACAKPLRLRYVSTGGQPALHHLIKLDPGASLTVLEEGLPGARSSVTLEAVIADGAALNHVRVQGPAAEHQSLTHLFARIGAESQFKSFTVSANGALTRNEAVLDIVGDDAVAHVAGAALGDGSFHHDDTVFVTHGAVGCESRQVFKKVLRNGAVGVFQGKILVKEGAQKTDGYQISQSLLLDDDSQFLAKPELEIYADDVACSHGSTSGAIDEEGLFYLRSRGIPEGPATNLMVLAFLAEAVDEIEDEALAETITALLETWLGGEQV